jgi:2-phospho-L-lactate transferase/gluconeogenesis factor (CofD/UPF0052 family)
MTPAAESPPTRKLLHIVAISGGTGLAALLSSLKRYVAREPAEHAAIANHLAESFPISRAEVLS